MANNTKLVINTEELRTQANNIKKQKTDLDALIANLTSLCAEMNTNWDGAACKEFISRFEAQIASLKKMTPILQVLSDYCAENADNMEQFDRTFASRINAV